MEYLVRYACATRRRACVGRGVGHSYATDGPAYGYSSSVSYVWEDGGTHTVDNTTGHAFRPYGHAFVQSPLPALAWVKTPLSSSVEPASERAIPSHHDATHPARTQRQVTETSQHEDTTHVHAVMVPNDAPCHQLPRECLGCRMQWAGQRPCVQPPAARRCRRRHSFCGLWCGGLGCPLPEDSLLPHAYVMCKEFCTLYDVFFGPTQVQSRGPKRR